MSILRADAPWLWISLKSVAPLHQLSTNNWKINWFRHNSQFSVLQLFNPIRSGIPLICVCDNQNNEGKVCQNCDHLMETRANDRSKVTRLSKNNSNPLNVRIHQIYRCWGLCQESGLRIRAPRSPIGQDQGRTSPIWPLIGQPPSSGDARPFSGPALPNPAAPRLEYNEGG